jgi:hypothetical protein
MSAECSNEHRFVKLESQVKNNTSEIDELKSDANHDREELKDILVTLTQLTTTLNTLKWCIVLFVSVFGSINVVLFEEVIKLL